jgi:hypothetical protein
VKITLVITPPVGAAIERTLELGAITTAGCPARVDTVTMVLPATVCHAVPR